MVKRLEFEIPEFLRVSWATEEARSTWEPRITWVSNMWQRLEREAVAIGKKPATLQVCPPDQLMNLTKWCLENGLSIIPLAMQGNVNHYANSTSPYDPNKPWAYRVVIGREKIVKTFTYFWEIQNHEAIGDQLGFPICCQQFFSRFWVRDGWRDLTYPMVMEPGVRKFDVHGPEPCNILLRWLGIRMVSHLPCSFNCAETKKIGKDYYDLGTALFRREALWLHEMLNWPVRWDSLHGIAIITTPAVRVLTSTDALSDRVTVDRSGVFYPSEAGTGNDFPFQKVNVAHLIKRSDTWSDNGFNSFEAMELAHDLVLNLAVRILKEGDRVIDLGCGNGILLEKIGTVIPRLSLQGIEIDPGRWVRGHRRSSCNIHLGDLNDDIWWNPPYKLSIISSNRLLELQPDDVHRLLERISLGSEYLLIYNYGGKTLIDDWRNYFAYLYGDSGHGNIRIHLLRSSNEAWIASGSGQENQLSASGDGIGGDADDNH